ncbi:MAG: hypothetical protein IKA10_06575 [Oscillospiraceae bacterium]|nr:hypothetical protein [Oscillospiraceae bacterium]
MYGVRGLSNDRLKIIAVVTMLTDHIGAYLFPHIMLLRIIGRISFPIFAFMVAEGCRYTKNKKRYLTNMILLSLVTYLLFYPVSSPKFLRIPFTFTFSIVLIYAAQNFFLKWHNDNMSDKIISLTILLIALAAVYTICCEFVVDYGIYGCLLPVFISFVWIGSDMSGGNVQYSFKSALIMLAFGLLLVYIEYGGVQIYSFLAIPLLCIYNGKRENILPKQFFYIFYPLHLAVIFAVKYLILI